MTFNQLVAADVHMIVIMYIVNSAVFSCGSSLYGKIKSSSVKHLHSCLIEQFVGFNDIWGAAMAQRMKYACIIFFFVDEKVVDFFYFIYLL
jgi:hypothetical protein